MILNDNSQIIKYMQILKMENGDLSQFNEKHFSFALPFITLFSFRPHAAHREESRSYLKIISMLP